jgi:hypothetical protein
MAVAPGSIPGLTEPNSAAAERARLRMMHMQPAMTRMGRSESQPSPQMP